MMCHGFFYVTFTRSPGVFLGLDGQGFCWRYNHDNMSETMACSLQIKFNNLRNGILLLLGLGLGLGISRSLRVRV